MIHHTIWVSIYSFKCFKAVWSGLFISALFSPCSYRFDRNEMLLRFLRIRITVMYFKDRNWIPKTVKCISCLLVCKIVFCFKFLDIPDKAGKITRRRRKRRRRRKTQAIAKRHAFHANAKIFCSSLPLFACAIFVRSLGAHFHHHLQEVEAESYFVSPPPFIRTLKGISYR